MLLWSQKPMKDQVAKIPPTDWLDLVTSYACVFVFSGLVASRRGVRHTFVLPERRIVHVV